MSEDAAPARIRRVTAVVESGRQATDLLVNAAHIAARLHAEVQGVLFDDANLRRLARLDVARVVSRFAAAGPVGPADVLAMIEQLAEQARSALRGAAQSLGLAWSFQVMLDAPGSDLRDTLRPHDLLMVELASEPTAAMVRQAAGLWAVAPGSMLIAHGRWRADRPVVAIAAASAQAAQALHVAADLLSADAPHLDVLLTCGVADAPVLAAWVRQRVRDRGRRVHVTVLPDGAVATMLRAARHAAADLLVLPADTACLAGSAQVEMLLEHAGGALLLVR